MPLFPRSCLKFCLKVVGWTLFFYVVHFAPWLLGIPILFLGLAMVWENYGIIHIG